MSDINIIPNSTCKYNFYSNKCLNYLIETGSYYEAKNRRGQTPHDIASSYGRIEISALIQQQGEKAWRSMPKRIAEQGKRINELETQMQLLQEQMMLLLDHFYSKSQNTAPQSLAAASGARGLFNHPPAHLPKDTDTPDGKNNQNNGAKFKN